MPAADADAGHGDPVTEAECGYFAQHQLDELDEGDTPYALVRRKMPQAGEAQIRARAAQLGFGVDKADTRLPAFPVAKRRGCCWGGRV